MWNTCNKNLTTYVPTSNRILHCVRFLHRAFFWLFAKRQAWWTIFKSSGHKSAFKNFLMQKQNVNIKSTELSKTVKSQTFFHVKAKTLLFFCLPDKNRVHGTNPFCTHCPQMLRRTKAPFFYRLWLCDRQAFQDGFLCFLFRTSLWWPEEKPVGNYCSNLILQEAPNDFHIIKWILKVVSYLKIEKKWFH